MYTVSDFVFGQTVNQMANSVQILYYLLEFKQS